MEHHTNYEPNGYLDGILLLREEPNRESVTDEHIVDDQYEDQCEHQNKDPKEVEVHHGSVRDKSPYSVPIYIYYNLIQNNTLCTDELNISYGH
jgi:hypothetical protein